MYEKMFIQCNFTVCKRGKNKNKMISLKKKVLSLN